MTSRIPPSRRDPEFAAQRVAKTVTQRVGGSGRVPQAAPNLSAEVAALIRGAHPRPGTRDPNGTSAGSFFSDRFTGAASSLTLSYAPLAHSLHLYVNGLLLDEGTDYTLTGATVTLAVGKVIAGDVVWARYARASSDITSAVIVPFGSTGWKYKVVGIADATDYSDPAFDDSAWSTGQAGFGTSNPYVTINTPVAVDQRLWLRRTIPAGSDFTVDVLIDNYASVYWNGTQVGSEVNGWAGSMAALEFSFTVPSGLVSAGEQVLAIRATDDAAVGGGDVFVIDAEVSGVLA